MLEEMESEGVRPNRVVYNTLLASLLKGDQVRGTVDGQRSTAGVGRFEEYLLLAASHATNNGGGSGPSETLTLRGS